MAGILYLIPTPLDDLSRLDPTGFSLLDQASRDMEGNLVVVEEAKCARRRWIHWGLPRDAISNFLFLNEHNASSDSGKLVQYLLQNKNIFLLSDGGLPAFCDPGRELVSMCHREGIRVTASPFANSVILALALSGFPHDSFVFQGFLPTDTEKRKNKILEIEKENRTQIVMDTPYRLVRTLGDFSASKRLLCLAMNLNMPDEVVVVGTYDQIKKQVGEEKREFILLIAPSPFRL